MISPRELKLMYERGENLSAALRQQAGTTGNTEEIIEWSYDIQAGSYIQALQKSEHAEINQNYTAEIARLLTSLGPAESILEAGIGEATTMGNVVRKLNAPNMACHGFDLSWSRIACARQWLRQEGVFGISLCTASLLHMPYADDSIDIVYTSHTIEPNGGREEPILRELYRVTRQYLVLLEPGYELASHEAQRRMESHGYCRDLPGIARSLGCRIIEHKLFPHTANPLNPTALTIIEKPVTRPAVANPLVCPRFKTPLKKADGMLFSPEALTVYPIIGDIPCLRSENGIIASRYLEFCDRNSEP
jgi:SAM-dependent methyltransferase